MTTFVRSFENLLSEALIGAGVAAMSIQDESMDADESELLIAVMS
jgi:hypothetical protein